jgi:CubicO group peptidase (beta-lactamase class C family)
VICFASPKRCGAGASSTARAFWVQPYWGWPLAFTPAGIRTSSPSARPSGWTPGRIPGLGFALRGEQLCRHHFGTLNAAQAFGNHGAGSTLFWIDPTRQMTFVCLTSGIMEESENVERFERLSDIALSAAM